MDQEENKEISFDLPKNRSNVIKVMGVGGGGSNAINYMFQQGIKGVDFIISNTDAQALSESGVPTKIQLGASLTEGLGAGANPEVGAKAAQESHEQIHNILTTQTKMIFITAGMGGGTGTGAAPIIAQMAKSMDILTVGIVTMPFQFEGKIRSDQAKIGVDKLRKQVDALIVINNNKLRDIYGNLGFKEGFAKADEVLATASKGIAEVITHHYTQNIDLKDAKTVLSNSGNAIMGSAVASGSKRSIEAISSALDSPLLNDNRITGAKNVLLLIVSGEEEITIDEIGLINDYIQERAGHGANIIMGVGEDNSLENSISVTVIATGFDPNQQQEIIHADPKKIIHSLGDNNEITQNFNDDKKKVEIPLQFDFSSDSIDFKNTKTSNVSIESNIDSSNVDTSTKENINDMEVSYEEINLDVSLNDNDQEIENISLNINEFKDVDTETIKPKDQVSLDFDMPISKNKDLSDKIVHELIEDINDIIVNDPVHIIPVNEVDGSKIKKSGIDDYSKLKEISVSSDIKENKKILNPINCSVSEGLAKRTEARKIKLKEYNYNFSKAKRVSEMEKEPAFKRAGVNLEDVESVKVSRTSVSEDTNGEINRRTNNSFLHDNVD